MDELVAENYMDHNPPGLPGCLLGEKWSGKDSLSFLMQIGALAAPAQLG